MEKTTIKAIELIRRIREAHYEQLKDKTRKERIAFYRAKARALDAKAQTMLQDQQGTDQQP